MPYSMTGMGRASGTIKDPSLKFDIEIKSYNHRFLEISVKCPNLLLPFEDEIRRYVQKYVCRGHIVVNIQQDREITDCRVDVDKPLLHAYMGVVEELKKHYKISGTIDINTLLSIQGLVKFSQPQASAKNVYRKFQPILEKAIRNFIRMKQKEGRNIARDIKKSLKIVKQNIDDIEKFIPNRNDEYEKHLSKLLKDYGKEINEDRFYQELLYTIDRTDVTEECKRLQSHLVLFKEALKKETHPGRKLNFLLQEMQREANTCSVKANFLKISKAIVEVKEEIEKIREQVQNIE
jgi:uncharacterized protein (TIGR00255 family)